MVGTLPHQWSTEGPGWPCDPCAFHEDLSSFEPGQSCLIPFVTRYLNCPRSDQWHHHVVFNLVTEQCYLTRSDKWYPRDLITRCAAIGYNFSEWALEYLPVTWTDKSRSWHILPLRFPPNTWTHLYNHHFTRWRLMLSKHSRETVIDIASRSKE